MPTCRRSTSPRGAQLKVLSDDLDNLKKQLQAQGDKLSDSERASKAKTIDGQGKAAPASGRRRPERFPAEMQELYNGLASKVYDVLASYAQQQGFTLVLDVAQQQNPVLYANDSSNITKPIIDAYKRQVRRSRSSGAAGRSGSRSQASSQGSCRSLRINQWHER